MTVKNFIDKFRTRYLWTHLGLMAALVVASVILAAVGTDLYTHHGEAITVPDLRNKNIDKAISELESLGLNIVVSDTSYNRHLPADCILQQIPAAGERVKSGRTIFVTINSASKPTLIIPDIIDNSSLREAMAMLKILGFKIGDPQYVPGEKDWIYGIVCHGRTLSAGDQVSIDDMVILQVGDGKLNSEDSLEVTDPGYEQINITSDELGDVDPFEEVH